MTPAPIDVGRHRFSRQIKGAASMRLTQYVLVVAPLAAVWCWIDLTGTLRTGRARLWLGGTVSRDHQPRRYWWQVFQRCVTFVSSVVIFVWAVLRVGPNP